MKYKIKTYGIAKDILGGREVILEADRLTVGELRQMLTSRHPALLDLRSLFIAVNLLYADDKHVLKENDEIALIPPVSGG